MIQDIEIDKIVSKNIINERLNDEVDESLIDLASSIKENGLIHPIILKKIEDDKYRVVCGQRRIMAHKLVGFQKIPSIVKEFKNTIEEFSFIIDENSKRENLNPYEKYISICKILFLMQKSNIEVSKDSNEKLLKDSIDYIKDIINTHIRTKSRNKEALEKVNTFMSNCKKINIKYSFITNNSFLNDTNKKIIDLLCRGVINFYVARLLHRQKAEDYFNELIEYIESLNKKIEKTDIERFVNIKNRKNKKEVSKDDLISLIEKINDKKSLEYLEKVIKKLEIKNQSKSKDKKI